VDLPTFNAVAPRIYAAYDLLGNGKSVLKGGWGRYYRMRQTTPDVLRQNRNGIAYGIFLWNDANGNRDYDEGEVNRDLNGPDYVETSGHEFESAQPPAAVNPNEKQPFYDQISLALEQEVMANFAIRVTGMYSTARDLYRIQNNLRPYESYNVPVTNTDPGPDGSLGTPDDGGLVTYYEFPLALAGQQFEEVMPINDASVDQSYSSFEVAAVRRLANRWQFMASYSATKKDRPLHNARTLSSLNATDELGAFNPNEEINRADDTWIWDAKMMGAYLFPADISASAHFEHRSGEAFARDAQFRGGETIPSIVLNVEPIGTRRMDHVNLLTLRVEKGFQMPGSQRLVVRFNVYNALNSNAATSVITRGGENFLRPRAIVPARIAEFGASYTF
jgi:hypothetical protein